MNIIIILIIQIIIFDSSCPKEYNKFISAKKQCIDECSKDDIYKYQFKSECYQECPPNTWQSNVIDNFCEIICSKESPFEILEKQECTNNCSIKDFYQKNVYQIINMKKQLLI